MTLDIKKGISNPYTVATKSQAVHDAKEHNSGNLQICETYVCLLLLDCAERLSSMRHIYPSRQFDWPVIMAHESMNHPISFWWDKGRLFHLECVKPVRLSVQVGGSVFTLTRTEGKTIGVER